MVNKKNVDMEFLKEFVPFEDDIIEKLKDSEFQKEFLNVTIEEFIDDGDYSEFFKSLEFVIKARCSLNEFSKQVNIDRANLYRIFKGDKNPRLETVGKILKELGFSLKVA